MENVVDFLHRASERSGFHRQSYLDKNVPTNSNNIAVMHWFGDTRSEFIVSSLLLKRFKEELKGSKYLVLASWKGHRHLFPYVDEYWEPTDQAALQGLSQEALGFGNTSDIYAVQQRNLLRFFDPVYTADDLLPYYDQGITKKFFEQFRTVKYTVPLVPSSGILEPRFNQDVATRPGWKVFLMPTRTARGWKDGKLRTIKVRREFWGSLIDRLSRSGFCPVVAQNYATHDLSADYLDRGIFVAEEDAGKLLAMMRQSACVLDVFQGLSRWAMLARVPFVALEERSRYAYMREHEIDALCAGIVPRQYIFSFATLLEDGDPFTWNPNMFDGVVARLHSFLPTIDRESLPTTSDGTVEVPYACVRERKAKRIGSKFVKISRD